MLGGQALLQRGHLRMRRPGLCPESRYREDTPHRIAQENRVGGFDIGHRQAATLSAANAAIAQPRQTPSTPQRSMRGVLQRPPASTNRLAAVAQTTSPSLLRIRPSSASLSGAGRSFHSARASTCSSRLQCFIPASAGCTANRVSHQRSARPARGNAGGTGWRDSTHVGSDASPGA